MNTTRTLNILLAAALLLLIIQTNFRKGKKETGKRTTGKEEVMSQLTPNALTIIHQRKSVRNFTRQAVSRQQLETLVRAGMAAPTAMNKQPWVFIAIDERKTLDELGDGLPYAKMLKQTPAAIVVCGDLNKTLEGKAQEFWIQGCSAATQNILLAAESMGLGAVWTGVYPLENQVKTVSTILGLPAHVIPLNVIPVGYPTGSDHPKDKWKAENLHWQAWQTREAR